MLFDLHVHTTFSSCSNLGIQDILAQARDRGLDGVGITDHDTMDIQYVMAEGMQDNGLLVIFGMEYATPDGDFLVYGPFDHLPPGLGAEGLLSIVAERSGIAIAAHPFRTGRSVAQRLIQQGLCHAVESINGRNSVLENARVRTWTRNYPLVECGGSDAHSIEELGAVATSIDARITNREDLVRAIKNGLCTPLWNTGMSCPSPAQKLSGRHR